MGRFHEPHAETEATELVLSLLGDELDTRALVAKHFDKERRYFSAAELLEARGWSSSETALIQVAAEVWAPKSNGPLGGLIAWVDDDAYRQVLQALALRRGVLLGIE